VPEGAVGKGDHPRRVDSYTGNRVARLMHFTSQKSKPVFADLVQNLHQPNPAVLRRLRC